MNHFMKMWGIMKETLFECHGHLMMGGADYAASRAVHEKGPDRNVIGVSRREQKFRSLKLIGNFMDQLEKRNRADLYPSFLLNHAVRNVACNNLLRAISFAVFTVFLFLCHVGLNKTDPHFCYLTHA